MIGVKKERRAQEQISQRFGGSSGRAKWETFCLRFVEKPFSAIYPSTRKIIRGKSQNLFSGENKGKTTTTLYKKTYMVTPSEPLVPVFSQSAETQASSSGATVPSPTPFGIETAIGSVGIAGDYTLWRGQVHRGIQNNDCFAKMGSFLSVGCCGLEIMVSRGEMDAGVASHTRFPTSSSIYYCTQVLDRGPRYTHHQKTHPSISRINIHRPLENTASYQQRKKYKHANRTPDGVARISRQHGNFKEFV